MTADGGGRPVIVVATNEAARGRGIKAGELVRTAATTLGGGGGGKDDIAQGGGQDPSRTGEALAAVEASLEAALASRAWTLSLRRGVRLGVDVGSVRVGVAGVRPGRRSRLPGVDAGSRRRTRPG